MEPLPDEPNEYRQAALYHLQIMLAVDDFITVAQDARLAVVAVAVVLGWPSTRGLSIGNIADQLGVSVTTITRACARFREMSGLAAGVRFIRPVAGSLNGDKPAAVQSVGNIPAEPVLIAR
jgi:Trp operon repressor